MKKTISFLLTLGILLSSFAFPVHIDKTNNGYNITLYDEYKPYDDFPKAAGNCA